MIDCHVHTLRCGHGQGTVAEYVAAARERGIDVITFTEHLPLPISLDPLHQYSMPEQDLGDYFAEIDALSRKHEETGSGPLVLAGLEADWLPDQPGHIERLLSRHRTDVVLGSIHFFGDWAFDDPELLERWDRADVDEIWLRYFELLHDAVSSGLFDVMAHPDLVKKFGHRPTFDPGELYEAAAASFSSAGVAIEVSTGGLRKPVGELYPGPAFLAACARAGVPATMGSDAHAPAELGFGFDIAYASLRAAGYDRLVYFVDREPKEYRL